MNKGYNLHNNHIDWENNDPTSFSYIKNRPFYKEKSWQSSSGVFTDFFDSVYDMIHFYLKPDSPIPIESGTKMEIDIKTPDGMNDFHYSGTWHTISMYDEPVLVLGNTAIVQIPDTEVSDAPFFLISLNGYLQGMCLIDWILPYTEIFPSLSIPVQLRYETQIIHKISKDFLPPIIGDYGIDENTNEIFNNYITNIASGCYSHTEGSMASYEDITTISQVEFSNFQYDDYYMRGTVTINKDLPQNQILKLSSDNKKNENFYAIIEYTDIPNQVTIYLIEPNPPIRGSSFQDGIYNIEVYKHGIFGGNTCHIEGINNTAITKNYDYRTDAAHCEGTSNKIIESKATHVEGYKNIANRADYSHIEGLENISSTPCQHIQGQYNIAGSYADIVGNGKELNGKITRSNAYTLDWLGNGWYQNSVAVAGTDMDTPDAKLEKDGITIKSSTPDSQKHFKIIVDDSGTITSIGDGIKIEVGDSIKIEDSELSNITGDLKFTHNEKIPTKATNIKNIALNKSGPSVTKYNYLGKTFIVIPNPYKTIAISSSARLSNITLFVNMAIDTSNVTNMDSMFSGSKATTLDLSSFDTSKVTNMDSMFSDSKATTLDLSSFDTSKVTNMWRMFYGCEINITTLDLSSFDTSNVTDMSSMFESSKITALDLSFFDTSNVTNMIAMFQDSKIPTLDLSSFDTSKVTTMRQMFNNSQATTIDLSSFNTSNVTNMTDMFRNSQATKIYCRTEEDKQRFLASSNCTPTAEKFIVGKPPVV